MDNQYFVGCNNPEGKDKGCKYYNKKDGKCKWNGHDCWFDQEKGQFGNGVKSGVKFKSNKNKHL